MNGTGGPVELVLEGKSSKEVSYHIMLLHEAGLVEAVDFSTLSGSDWKPTRLTWQGHEFLEAVKDYNRWNKVKDAMSQVGGFVYEVAKQVALSLLKDQLSSNPP